MLAHRIVVAMFAVLLSATIGYSHAGSGSFQAPDVIEFGASVSKDAAVRLGGPAMRFEFVIEPSD